MEHRLSSCGSQKVRNMKSLICSFILIVAFAIHAEGKDASMHFAKRAKMTQIKCKAVPMDPELARTRKMVRAKNEKKKLQAKKAYLSLNWAGYVAATSFNHPKNNSVEVVSGAWVAPFLAPSQEDSFAAIFVGIDGFFENSPTVEQIGTIHFFVSGVQFDFVFVEVFPSLPLELVGFPVKPGDVMGGEVAFVGNDRFIFYIMNFTHNVYAAISLKARGVKRNSAEWIVEAPTVDDSIQPLANFTSIPFLECTAKIDGEMGAINDDDARFARINMLSESFVPKAAPTKLRMDGTEFLAGWLSPGP